MTTTTGSGHGEGEENPPPERDAPEEALGGGAPAAPGESPPDEGVGRGTPDRVVPARTFLAVGLGLGVLAVIYAVTAGEEAGMAMLALAAVLGLWSAGYLWLRLRSPADEPEEVEEPFLPHASVWPFLIGVGAALLANGLLIGGWFFLPGAALLAAGIGGFVRETRARLG